MSLRLSALLVLVSFTFACGQAYLRTQDHYADEPGFAIDEESRIADTVDHRQVIDVLLQYRRALVRKDVGALQRLISDKYYDNGGTTNTTTDDYGSDALPELYELLAAHAESIKYDVLVKKVEISDGAAHVDYEFKYAYQYKVGESPSWDAGLDVNRLELAEEGGEWKIVSGL